MMMVGGANGAAFVSITYRILLGIRIAGIVMSSWEGRVDCNGCSSWSGTGENVRGNKSPQVAEEVANF